MRESSSEWQSHLSHTASQAHLKKGRIKNNDRRRIKRRT
nr:MAG TPA: hypothetical protein [Caudoviricetes sp.]